MAHGNLGTLLGVTVVCDDLMHIAAKYAEALGYRGEVPGPVGLGRASTWGSATAATCLMATLFPVAGGHRFIRFVESAGSVVPAPHSTTGWNAVELMVQDLDRLADRLDARSEWTVVGPPAVLEFDFTDKIRAMQVLGPAGELLYFTVVDGPVPGFELPVARCPVDAPFVAILGTCDIDASAAWYARATGQNTAGFDARVAGISKAHGLPSSQRHRLATASLPDAALIEIDMLPVTSTASRRATSCGLPSGIAIVTLADRDGTLPTLVGPDNELIELAAPGAKI